MKKKKEKSQVSQQKHWFRLKIESINNILTPWLTESKMDCEIVSTPNSKKKAPTTTTGNMVEFLRKIVLYKMEATDILSTLTLPILVGNKNGGQVCVCVWQKKSQSMDRQIFEAAAHEATLSPHHYTHASVNLRKSADNINTPSWFSRRIDKADARRNQLFHTQLIVLTHCPRCSKWN